MRNVTLAVLVNLASTNFASATDLDANKLLVRSYIEDVFNKRQLAAIDRYILVDYAEHNPNLPPGLAGKRQFVASVLAGFSDYHAEIQDILAEGDKVVVRTRWTGTQDGSFLGLPPSGHRVSFSTADFYRIQNGRLAEHWDVVDSLPRAVALGLVPAPKPPGQTALPQSR